MTNDGGMRQEIEIDILTNNNAKFVGSITPKEAKYTIYNFKTHLTILLITLGILYTI